MERCPIIEVRKQREHHHQNVSQRVNLHSDNGTISERYISKHADIEMSEGSHEEQHNRNPKHTRCDECILA